MVTLNTRGAMGAGIALGYRERFPASYKKYRARCFRGEFTVNTILVHRNGNEWWVLFPTKDAWHEPSRLEWIEENLRKLADICRKYKVAKIAMPLLGCGNGQLMPEQALALIEAAFLNHPTECIVVNL